MFLQTLAADEGALPLKTADRQWALSSCDAPARTQGAISVGVGCTGTYGPALVSELRRGSVLLSGDAQSRSSQQRTEFKRSVTPGSKMMPVSPRASAFLDSKTIAISKSLTRACGCLEWVSSSEVHHELTGRSTSGISGFHFLRLSIVLTP